jgi:hypothetical protein
MAVATYVTEIPAILRPPCRCPRPCPCPTPHFWPPGNTPESCYRPRVRALTLRIARIFAVALLAYLAIAWSSARGMPWVGWTLAASLLVALLALSLFQRQRHGRARREASWERAIYDAERRGKAIGELKREIRRLEPVKQRSRAEHARLSVLLAELLDAEGEHEAAMATVDGIGVSALPRLDAGLVRHTRAVTHLRAADPQGAQRALEGREPSGDVELDHRLGLLEAYAYIELGHVQKGLDHADGVARAPGVDPSVIIEARVVRAAALDALGKREEALVVLAALGRESLAPLAELGHPRVRVLARQVLDGAAA